MDWKFWLKRLGNEGEVDERVKIVALAGVRPLGFGRCGIARTEIAPREMAKRTTFKKNMEGFRLERKRMQSKLLLKKKRGEIGTARETRTTSKKKA